MSDEQRIIDLSVTQAQVRLENQFRNVDALDVKALGVLAADVAALGVVIATHDTLNRLWWLPAVGLAVAGVLLLVCVWPRALDEGPSLREFFVAFGGGSYHAASIQMLGELLAAIEENERRTPFKGHVFKLGFELLVLALAATFVVALVR
jgi:hypothetical protein